MSRVCKDTIRGRVGDAFSDAEIDDALERLTLRFRSKKFNKENLSPDAAETARLREAVEDMTSEALEASLIEKRLRLKSAVAKSRREAHLEGLSDLPLWKRLRALNVGLEENVAGAGLSVDTRSRAYYRGWSTALIRDLDKAGTLSRLSNPLRKRDRDFENDVARELSLLNGGDVASTGNAEALTTARIMKKYQDASIEAQNAQGAWISRLDGYVTRQSHDAIKISGGFFRGAEPFGVKSKRREQSKKEWIDYITPRLAEQSFDGVDDIEAYLGQMWTDIVTGHHNPSSSYHDDLDAFKPNGLVARKVSAARVLHFKTVDDWLAYNDRFGAGGIFEGYISQLDRAASNAALMEVYGPNPQAAYTNLKDDYISQAREAGDTVSIKQLSGGVQGALRDAEFGELDGSALAPGSVRLAAFGRGFRLQQGLSKLGGMTLSSISDTSLAAHTLQRYGVDLLDGYNGLFQGITGLQNAASKEAADLAGVGVNQIMGDIASRYATTDGAYGVMGKLQSAFYKINLFSEWGGRVRGAVGGVLSAHMGSRASVPAQQLDPAFKAGLNRYGIDDALWDAVRGGAAKIDGDPDNRLWFTPEAADSVSNAKAKAWGKENGFSDADAARGEMRLRLQAYFSDIADTAMTEPRARENALITMGTRPGTALGEAVRFVMQFKSFPTTVITRQLGPTIQDGKPTMATAHLIVAGTALGFAALQAKQLVKGLSPHPLVMEDGSPNMKVLVQSLVQGGGLGIYGDFLLADYNRFGGSPLETLSGPAIGEMSNALRIFGALKDGDDVAARALRQSIGNVPFNNLFYTRAALDYAVFYQMQEWVNPGSLERYEARVKSERGQTFLIPPSETVN